MEVLIPNEEWERFKEQHKEAGSLQFSFGKSTIFAKVIKGGEKI